MSTSTGAYKVWELAQSQNAERQSSGHSQQSDYILYVHNRGVSHNRIDLGLFQTVAGDPAGAVEIFRQHPEINKINWASSPAGFGW